ncbi:hypothetical protein P154DRAFT_467275, partial [Amniculicola lignicola CBS 123094]
MPPPAQANKRKTGDNERPSKRSRVSRACDQCRTAREKCDGTQPICITCSAVSRPCTYTTNPKKRGIQPGYIRTLELALTWLFINVPDAESALSRKLVQEGINSVLLARDSKDSNTLHKNWRKSKFCKDVDKLLSGEQITDTRSPESEQDTDPEEVNVRSPSPDLGRLDAITIPQATLDNIAPSTFRVSETSQPISLPVNGWRLFDIYFAYTHSWFPICEKHDVLKLTYSYPDHGLHLSSAMAHSGEHAELWSIMALASLRDLDQPSDLQPSHTWLYNVALTLMPFETGSFELGHVKGLLILSLVHMERGLPETAWLLIGYASRILIGLEEKEKRNQQPNQRFKHVAAGCFLLDTTLSMQLRRRPYLQVTDLERIEKIDEDGIEEWQPWAASADSVAMSSFHRPVARSPVLSLSTFNNLVELVGILGVATFNDNSRSIVRDALGRFEAWKASLPPKLDYVRVERASTPTTPPAILFQLVYYYTSSLLYSSQSWIQRIAELLENARDAIGLMALPPLLVSVLDLVGGTPSYDMTDYRVQGRYQAIRSECSQIKVLSPSGGPHLRSMTESLAARSRPSFASANVQALTPESLRNPLNSFAPIDNNQNRDSGRPPADSTLLDDLLPDMSAVDPGQHSMAFPNIENFFDELASLDGAERVENQPQFMQNLGFAPDANIADFLA